METLTKEEIQPLLDARGQEQIDEAFDQIILTNKDGYPTLYPEARARYINKAKKDGLAKTYS